MFSLALVFFAMCFGLGVFLAKLITTNREYKELLEKKNSEVLLLTDGVLTRAGLIEDPEKEEKEQLSRCLHSVTKDLEVATLRAGRLEVDYNKSVLQINRLELDNNILKMDLESTKTALDRVKSKQEYDRASEGTTAIHKEKSKLMLELDVLRTRVSKAAFEFDALEKNTNALILENEKAVKHKIDLEEVAKNEAKIVSAKNNPFKLAGKSCAECKYRAKADTGYFVCKQAPGMHGGYRRCGDVRESLPNPAVCPEFKKAARRTE